MNQQKTPAQRAAELQYDLECFAGSDNWYSHWTRRGTYTDGVKFLAEKAGAFWLIDEIFGRQIYPAVRAEEFQVWKLIVKDSAAQLSCGNGNRDKEGNWIIVHKAEIKFTDFPLPEIKLYFENRVLCLPRER